MKKFKIPTNLGHIDIHNLEVEWAKHPETYHELAQLHAMAKLSLNELKDKILIIGAEVELEIRSQMKGKSREGDIKAQKILHPRLIKFNKKINMMQNAVDKLGAALSAMEHRKKALENIVDLQLGDYFAAPRERKKKIRSKGRREE